MKADTVGWRLLACLAVSLLAVGCAEDPTTLTEVAEVDQPRGRFNDVNYVESPSLGGEDLASVSRFSHPIDIAGVGANDGLTAAAQVIGTGDISGTFTIIGTGAFNAMSVPALRAAFDVLIFTWVSNPAINADWNTRLLPYMALGGGIVFEDPGQLSDLPPGVVSGGPCFGSGSMTVTAAVPGLTVGIAGAITGAMANNHFCFASWDPALSPFLSHSFIPTVTGLWGRFGAGCIVLTGPDQHFHGSKFAGGFSGNQYRFLVNELDFVSHGCGNLPPDADAGDDQTGDDAVEQGDPINLDGLGSSDDVGIVSFTWSRIVNGLPFVVAGPNVGSSASIFLPLGTHLITLEVEDGNGATDTDDVFIQVIPVPIVPGAGGSAPVVNQAGVVVGTVVIPPAFFGGEVPVPITAEFVEGECPVLVLGAEGLCLSITIPPEAVINGLAVIGLCFGAGTSPPENFAIFQTHNGQTVVLRNVPVTLTCGPPEGPGASNLGANPVTRFARGLWQQITRPFRPRVLSATFGDEGVGGEAGEFSDFQWGPQLFVEEAEVDDGEIEISGTFDLAGESFNKEDVTITFGGICPDDCIRLTLEGAAFEEDDGASEFESEDGDVEIEFQIDADGRFELDVKGVDVDVIDDLSFVPVVMEIGERLLQGVGLEFDEDGECVGANGSGGCDEDDDDDDDDD